MPTANEPGSVDVRAHQSREYRYRGPDPDGGLIYFYNGTCLEENLFWQCKTITKDILSLVLHFWPPRPGFTPAVVLETDASGVNLVAAVFHDETDAELFSRQGTSKYPTTKEELFWQEVAAATPELTLKTLKSCLQKMHEDGFRAKTVIVFENRTKGRNEFSRQHEMTEEIRELIGHIWRPEELSGAVVALYYGRGRNVRYVVNVYNGSGATMLDSARVPHDDKLGALEQYKELDKR
ncbi:hypothetical protein EK21DRAFT_117879 [Setomelanomma holmii]|uniref:Uncharacterized protein n=1 Tax=Setomelanomma holmii TaxID=210430 RepID=A0A9P4LHN2_9PLEO|nr:hypothetical protein EK21DRAFT_117879 [Setomelanomma holmii]